MISRYTRPEMGAVWMLENRFRHMMGVEVTVALVQAELRLIPQKAAQAIKAKAHFDVARIEQIEKETRHDVIAFVTNMAENVGEYGRFIHFGLTSSDVIDTAFSLQVREAGEILLKSMNHLEKNLKVKIRSYAGTLCAGRTHGMFAEPTTFGLKLAGFLAELERNRARIERALEQMAICKLSGAVGTYSSQSEEVEKRVAKKLGLRPELIATQVIPRDRHAEMIFSLAMLGAGLERLAVELRHLQRSEVAEVSEGFSKGQKGSSAMPHKKNPISAENITGISRLLRSYAQASLENISLWHERDISHSSVERVIFPDAFIAADYAVERMSELIRNLEVYPEQMRENVDRSRGQLFSSQVLLALVEKGLDRELAYRHVQRLSHSLGKNQNLKTEILKDSELKKLLKKSEVEEIFSGNKHKAAIEKVLQRVL